jgi:hypothetical protein
MVFGLFVNMYNDKYVVSGAWAISMEMDKENTYEVFLQLVYQK